MTPPPQQDPPPDVRHDYDDGISLTELIQTGREWARVVWGERRFIAKVVAVSVSLGMVIAFGSRPEYTSSIKILPYRSGGGGPGLSGLAGLAGIRLSSGTGDQTITADLYPEVAKTLDFRVAVAETPIRFSSLPAPVTPMRYFREIAPPSKTDVLKKYTIALPGTLLAAIFPRPELGTAPVADSGPSIKSYDSASRQVLSQLEDRLTVSSDKKTLIITMIGRMPDRFAAADLVRTASEALMTRLIEYEAKKASEQVRFSEEQVARAKSRLDKVQREQALLADRLRGTVSATAQLESQRLQREYSLALDIYSRVTADLEQATLKKAQDTPVFTVLDQVVVPNYPSSPRRGLILFLAAILGFVISSAIVANRHMSKRYPSNGGT